MRTLFHLLYRKKRDDLRKEYTSATRKRSRPQISALLHDLVEDTDTTFDDIKCVFGEKITYIVRELTKPKKGNKEEWLKNFELASIEAKTIKMADRIDNLLDMNIKFWTIEKQKEYANQGKIILKNCGNANLKLANQLKNLIEKKTSSL